MKRYTGPEIPGTCERCGNRILTRTAMSTGRQYQVDDAPGKQWHRCQGDAPKHRFRRGRMPNVPVVAVYGERPDVTEEAKTIDVRAVPDSPNGNGLDALVKHYILEALRDARDTGVDETAVRRIVQECVGESGRLHVEVSVRGSDAPAIDVGRQHMQFPTLLHVMGRRRNIWLAGPAGSGKTTACHKAADALGLKFYAISVGPQTTQAQVFGYQNVGTETYVRSLFRDAYEFGGVFLFDEIDRGNPGVLTALNQAIENGMCAFPDGMVARHPDFVAVAAANTFGNGADRQYVGALQLDAATLDRFAMLDWQIDLSLERDVALATYAAAGGTDRMVIEAWLSKVLTARNAAERLKMRVVVSPRASIVGADLLGSGLPENVVADMCLYKGMSSEDRARVS